MSRIGKKAVAIPAGVTANIDNGTLSVKGPKGTLAMGLSDLIDYKVEGDEIQVNPANDSKQARSFWGMQRTLVSNLVEGVTEGFSKTLEISGVGYRAKASGSCPEPSHGNRRRKSRASSRSLRSLLRPGSTPACVACPSGSGPSWCRWPG